LVRTPGEPPTTSRAPSRHGTVRDGVDYRKVETINGEHVSNETADLIVVASMVHAMVADAAPVAVLAIRDGRIAATAGPDGRRDLLAAWCGRGTVMIDEPGLVVLPAFFGTHNHLMLAAQNILGVPVSQARDIPGLVRLIRERASQTPPGSGFAPPLTGMSCDSRNAACPPRPSSTRPRRITRCCFSAAGTTGCLTPPGCDWPESAATPRT
jgi:hypothetical protein